MIRRIPYGDNEKEIIRECFERGMNDEQIAAALSRRTGWARNPNSVNMMRKRLHLVKERPAAAVMECDGPPLTEEEDDFQRSTINSDAEFQSAMLRAAKRGKEHVQKGTFVDRTPSHAIRLQPEPATSGCGSSAALAVEHGDPSRAY